MDPEPSDLPPHVEDALRSDAELHADHHDASTPPQRVVARLVSVLGQPRSLGLLTALILCWVGGNLFASAVGQRPLDRAPFPWLDLIISVAALYLVFLILMSQRRDDELSEYRERLTLHLAVLNDQKTSKIIALLEEQRRDSPLLHDREDAAADAMATTVDPRSALDASHKSQAGSERARRDGP